MGSKGTFDKKGTFRSRDIRHNLLYFLENACRMIISFPTESSSCTLHLPMQERDSRWPRQLRYQPPPRPLQERTGMRTPPPSRCRRPRPSRPRGRRRSSSGPCSCGGSPPAWHPHHHRQQQQQEQQPSRQLRPQRPPAPPRSSSACASRIRNTGRCPAPLNGGGGSCASSCRPPSAGNGYRRPAGGSRMCCGAGSTWSASSCSPYTS